MTIFNPPTPVLPSQISTRAGFWFEMFIFFLIVVNAVCFALGTDATIAANDGAVRAFNIVEFVSVCIFTLVRPPLPCVGLVAVWGCCGCCLFGVCVGVCVCVCVVTSLHATLLPWRHPRV